MPLQSIALPVIDIFQLQSNVIIITVLEFIHNELISYLQATLLRCNVGGWGGAVCNSWHNLVKKKKTNVD